MLSLPKTITVVFLLGAYRYTTAQPCNGINLGTKTLYANPVGKITPPPVGYQPVYINYVSRHGARHLTKAVSSSYAWGVINKADSMKTLTAEGAALLSLLKKLEAVEKGNVKNISAEGVQEQQAIAKRMYTQNENVFRLPVRYRKADVTKEIRTRQTATVFISTLQQLAGEKDSVRYMVNDTTLRFFDLSPAYLQFEESGNWKKTLQQLKTSLQWNAMIQQAVSRWLTPAFVKNLSTDDQEKLVTDVYGFYTILPSLKKEAAEKNININADSIGHLFSCAALEKLSRADVAEDYLAKGPGTNVMGVQVKIAAPLLADFINTTDAFIQTATEPITLRFCHAETIAPFAALLSLNGANKAVANINSFSSKTWNAATVVPLSANVQWIVYKSDTANRYLVKCLLNEKETKIDGLATKQFPYYNWQDVRVYYLKKLQRLKLGLNDNGFRYLQSLK